MRKRHRRQLREVASGRRRRNLSRDKYKQYSNEDMRAALEEVSEGEKIIKTARKYEIPNRTLYDRVRKIRKMETSREAQLQTESVEEELDFQDIQVEDYSGPFDPHLHPFDLLDLVIDIDNGK